MKKTRTVTIKLPRINYWAVVSFILLSLLIFTVIKGKFYSTAPKEVVGKKVIDFINSNLVRPGTSASLVDVKNLGPVYEIDTRYQGGLISVYAIKGGKMLVIPKVVYRILTCEDIPKKEKPNVELFVFSYCPFGIQYEKGLIPVVDLLGNKVNIKVIFIGAMHGQHEEIESKRQLCIREEQPDKFWRYLKCFVYNEKIKESQLLYYNSISCILGNTECNQTLYNSHKEWKTCEKFKNNRENLANCLETKFIESIEPYINKCLNEAGVNRSKLIDCMKNRADKYYKSDNQFARKYGISSSPTTRVNGVIITELGSELAGRSPEAIKNAICCGFKEKPPECDQTLDTETPSYGFGSGKSPSSSGKC